jgi:hypothetical protein
MSWHSTLQVGAMGAVRQVLTQRQGCIELVIDGRGLRGFAPCYAARRSLSLYISCFRTTLFSTRKSPLTHFESSSNSNNAITALFSSTYWEVPFRLCVVNKLLGGSFIFNIFFMSALYFQ